MDIAPRIRSAVMQRHDSTSADKGRPKVPVRFDTFISVIAINEEKVDRLRFDRSELLNGLIAIAL